MTEDNERLKITTETEKDKIIKVVNYENEIS